MANAISNARCVTKRGALTREDYMTEEAEQGWKTAEEKASGIAQARAFRKQARKGGLRFQAYLPSGLAEWGASEPTACGTAVWRQRKDV